MAGAFEKAMIERMGRKKKVLWTDGSAVPNPGPGGYAVIENGKPVRWGRADLTTNIVMEGKAILEAIKYAGEGGCEIRTDSEFWVKVLKIWAENWEARNWRTAAGKPVANVELVKEIWDLYREDLHELVWVRGHVGTEGNELADKWANEARLKNI